MNRILKIIRDFLNRFLKEENSIDTSIIGVSYHRSFKYLGLEIPIVITVESISKFNGIKLYQCKVSYFQNKVSYTHSFTERELKDMIFFKTE